MVQESVALRVTYERKIANWKKLTDTVTNFIAKDSLPVECSTLPTYIRDQCHQALFPPPNKSRNGNRDWVYEVTTKQHASVISIMLQCPLRLGA